MMGFEKVKTGVKCCNLRANNDEGEFAEVELQRQTDREEGTDTLLENL